MLVWPLIAELGYGQASFARIAERACLSSTRLISYHFAGRDELITAVAEDVIASIAEYIRSAGFADSPAPAHPHPPETRVSPTTTPPLIGVPSEVSDDPVRCRSRQVREHPRQTVDDPSSREPSGTVGADGQPPQPTSGFDAGAAGEEAREGALPADLLELLRGTRLCFVATVMPDGYLNVVRRELAMITTAP